MQVLPLNLFAGNAYHTVLQVDGSAIYFESGTSSTTNTYVLVKTEDGSEFRLKPGQSIRLKKRSAKWYFSSEDGVSAINGKLIIGDGEFNDSANTVALDATFANLVTVQNGEANPIPFENTAMTYTGSYNATIATLVAAGSVTLVTAAANTHGIIVEYSQIQASTAGVAQNTLTRVLAGADVLLASQIYGTTPTSDTKLPFRMRIAAGKALTVDCVSSGGSTTFGMVSVLWNVLTA
jgi:hypothetical protein